MNKLRFETASVSDAGIVKEINEDSYICKLLETKEHFAGIFAVADGVGGLAKGEVASLKAVSNINKWWESEFKAHYEDFDYLIRSLQKVFYCTNLELLEYGRKNNLKLATTMTALLLYKNQYVIVHSGDSRVYRFRRGITFYCDQLSEDHSCIVQKNRNHQIYYKRVLTECLGNKESCKQFVSMGEIKKNDIFIICSDGLYKTLDTKQMVSIVKKNKKDVKKICTLCLDTVKQNRETDNISAIVLKAYNSR